MSGVFLATLIKIQIAHVLSFRFFCVCLGSCSDILRELLFFGAGEGALTFFFEVRVIDVRAEQSYIIVC